MYEFSITDIRTGGSSGNTEKWTYKMGDGTTYWIDGASSDPAPTSYTLQVVIKNNAAVSGLEYEGWTLLDSAGQKLNTSDTNKNGKAAFFATYSGLSKLRITKQVSGEYASTTHAFPQTITLTLPNWAKDDAITAKDASNEDLTGVSTDDGVTRTYTVNLAHGQTATFDVPAGTRYSVVETTGTDFPSHSCTPAYLSHEPDTRI